MSQKTETGLKSLLRGQLDQFHKKGFVAVGPLLEEGEVRELREEYDRLFAEARQSARMRNLSTADGEATTEADEEMLQIVQMCERSILYRRLLYDDRLLDIAEDLIGPNLQLFHDQALYKPPRHGGPIHWHQDNGYWKCLPANLVSCWLTLDDVDVHNGAMHLIPGSHLRPERHERQEGTPLFDLGGQVDAERAEVVELPAGGVMFHHCQTLHHTPRNNTGRERRAFAIHYMNPGTRSMRDGEYMPVSFARPLLRMHM